MKQLSKGFSLIELVVVIGIIGLLASAVAVGFGRQRARARDAKRESDINLMANGYESMFEDRHMYSMTGAEHIFIDTSIGAGTGDAAGVGQLPTVPGNDWDPQSDARDLVTGGYLRYLPKDPINDLNFQYLLELDDELRGYYLRARLEVTPSNSTYYRFGLDNGKQIYVKASNDYISGGIN